MAKFAFAPRRDGNQLANLLLISLVFAPDGVSTATLVSALVEDLQKRGHAVQVITTMPHYNVDAEAQAQQPLTRRWGGLFSTSRYRNIPVWHTQVARKGDDAGGRILGYLLFNVLSLWIGLFFVQRPDVILVVSPPLTSGVVSWLLAKLRRAKTIYNVQELYPDTFVKMGRMDANSSTARLLYAVERFIYRRTDMITVICRAFERTLARKPAKPRAIELIPNFVDPDEIQPGEKRNALSVELGLADKFVVLYAGNLGQTQSFDTLLTVAEQLCDQSEIHFLIVGGGTRQEYIERTITERNLQNVTLLPYQPRSRVPEIYATCDLGLVPLMRGTAETTLPSKLYTIMASGRAVVAAVDEDSDIAETVREANCGITLPPDDADALREAILAGWADPEKMRQYGENGRQHALAHFSRQSVSRQYDELLRRLTGG